MIVMDTKNKPYFHLIDGGVADNIGLRAIEESIHSVSNIWTTLQIAKSENIHKIVFIMVNAEAKLDSSWDKHELIPIFAVMLKNYSTISIARYNRETMALLQESFTR
ncbi:MAG: hypothetical protein ABSB79_04050 [Syntrophales bacterium]